MIKKHIPNDGWIGVDLDGTLAEYSGWQEGLIGKPIPLMVDRVKQWLKHGQEVKIFTARVSHIDDKQQQTKLINIWCIHNIGAKLEVTCTKDSRMIELWDDRAVQVIPNTGERADGQR